MEWPWLFLYLSLHITGCQKTPPIFQTPPRIIALNNSTMELVCALKSEQFTQSGIYWYRWSKEIQDFQYVLFSNVFQKHTITNNIDKDRFNVSKGSSRHAYTLKIRKLQPLDAGTYYCAVSHSSELLFGNGTELSVVDSLPSTEKPTEKTPPPVKPLGCKTSSITPAKMRGSSCSAFILAPLVACAVILLLSLVAAIRRFQHLRRRLRLHFNKQVPK
ncbi:T-cell surface glycoprotein CD8 beta chain isoform X1 [Gopherus flavomarginatus]|uniref:T-cell surface glycoprotein CD8 beta chain isoform X1 n=1 Tax=Gopherus flavomarginatus TaxID=286002 RepID=UPI0021CBA503|nr:T-cell surface glycoprotein CD8 beta chain isoform X1 [Gopherus flavomarginatus]